MAHRADLSQPVGFRRWLAALHPYDKAGYCGTSPGDPLGNYLEACGAPRPVVGASAYYTDHLRQERPEPLPGWAVRFQEGLLAMTTERVWISAGDALRLLDALAEAIRREQEGTVGRRHGSRDLPL